MRSALPKVMHDLAGAPLLSHVISTSQALLAERPGHIIVVTGHGRESVDPLVTQAGCRVVHQDAQLGTGHAVQTAMADVEPQGQTLVLYGDVPLVTAEHLRPLLDISQDDLAVLTARLDDPTGYGRIVRGPDGAIQRIVEQRDATESELAITEINSGIYAGPTAKFLDLLPQLTNDNAQAEYYLTDCVALTVAGGGRVEALVAPSEVTLGVNDREQLADMNARIQNRRRSEAMRNGATLLDPKTVYFNGDVRLHEDVIVEPNVTFNGSVEVGANSRIGFGSHITDARIAAKVTVKPYSVIESGSVGEGAVVGPFARIRPGTELGPNTHLGNFCETKNAIVGEGSKINHLTYIGDAVIGQDTNIGAGTITCNYDGAHKHLTRLGDRVFIGSNTSLVAPVTVGDGATTGAGSVITRDVEANALALTRSDQVAKPNFQRPSKTKE